MKLTKEQQVKVEQNLGLVYKMLGDNAENSYDSRLWLKPFIGYSAIISRSFPRPATGLCN